MTKIFTLYGENIKDLETFYDEIQRVLCPGFQEFGRNNLNALDDVLSGGFGSFEYGEEVTLVWKASSESRESLGYVETQKYYHNLARQADQSNLTDIVGYERDASNQKGPTLFDIIIEIIRDHANIRLVLE